MEKKYIVEVFVPTKGHKGEKGMIGTGYPVGKGLLLTARHVLYPANRDKKYPIQVRFSALGIADAQWEPIVGVAWEGTEALDVSLVEASFPPEVNRWGSVMAAEPADHVQWISEGFAAAGGKKNGKRQSASMGGKVFSKQETESYFELGTDYAPQTGQDWRGASGSPVFVGGWIIGVITHCPEKFGSERLKATKMKCLLAHEDFAKHLLPNQRQQRLDLMQQQIAGVLGQSETVMQTLALEAGIAARSWELTDDTKGSASNLAAKLLQMELQPVLDACDSVHLQFAKRGQRKWARITSQLTLLLLPALYDFAVVETVRGDRFNTARAIIPVPTALRTVAEIIMAGVDRRSMQVQYDPDRDFPQGSRCLTVGPESTSDESGDQAKQDFLNQVANLLAPEFDPDFIHRFRKHVVSHFARREPGRKYDPELQTDVKSAALKLKRFAEKLNQTYYYVFDMPQNDEERVVAQRTIAQLKADFPAIVFLTLTPDEALELQEQERFAALPEMFSSLRDT